jgi:hypothetical protein
MFEPSFCSCSNESPPPQVHEIPRGFAEKQQKREKELEERARSNSPNRKGKPEDNRKGKPEEDSGCVVM